MRMSHLLNDIVKKIGWPTLVWRVGLQALLYIWFFSQPFLLQEVLSGDGFDGARLVASALLVGSLVALPTIDGLNNSLFQSFRRYSKSLVAEKVISQSYRYFADHTPAEVQSYLKEISFSCRSLEDSFVHTVLKLSVMVVLYTVSMLRMSPMIGVAYLLFIVAYVALSARLAKLNRCNVGKSLEATALADERLQDIHNNMATVITRHERDREFRGLDRLFAQEQETYSATQARTNTTALVQQVTVVVFASIVLLLFGMSHSFAGEFQTSLLTFVYSILNLTGFGPQYLLIREMLDRGTSALEALALSEEKGCDDCRTFDAGAQGIAFEDVSFSYEGGKRAVDSLSLNVAKGSMTALVGPNGSGKSTLLKIGAGLLIPSSGRVILPVASDASIMYLDQAGVLFNRSLLDNICYGTHPPSNLMQLVREIGLDTVITSEEQLIHLTPGSLSGKLSGGEQQKILILRALVAKPDVLFCDEITSALDPVSSSTFYRLLRERLPEATVVCTVHRTWELEHFDRVIRLE